MIKNDMESARGKMKIGMNKKYIEYIMAGVLFTITIGVFLYCHGTLQSGYHLQDDHEFYSIAKLIEKIGMGKAMVHFVKSDLSIRFRPWYWVCRVVGVFLLGTNFKLWSMGKALEISIAMTLFYIFARQRKINGLLSVCFSLLIFVGEQSEIWWRLGPQESGGALLCAIALLTTNWLSHQNSLRTKMCFIVSLILLSLQKEAFLIIIPAFFILLWGYELESGNKSSEKWWSQLKQFIGRHLPEIVIVGTVFLIEICIVVFYVGVNSIGYAGISSDMNIADYVHSIGNILFVSNMKYMVVLLFVLLVVQIASRKENVRKTEILELLFCLYVFGVELILYAKSGMGGRYLIPWTISISYMVVIITYKLIRNNKRAVCTLSEICLVGVLCVGSKVSRDAKNFSEIASDFRNSVYFILENSTQTDCLLGMSRWREDNNAFGIYMQEEYGYSIFNQREEGDEVLQNLLLEADVLWGRNGDVYSKMEDRGIDLNSYKIYMTPSYEVAIKQ